MSLLIVLLVALGLLFIFFGGAKRPCFNTLCLPSQFCLPKTKACAEGSETPVYLTEVFIDKNFWDIAFHTGNHYRTTDGRVFLALNQDQVWTATYPLGEDKMEVASPTPYGTWPKGLQVNPLIDAIALQAHDETKRVSILSQFHPEDMVEGWIKSGHFYLSPVMNEPPPIPKGLEGIFVYFYTSAYGLAINIMNGFSIDVTILPFGFPRAVFKPNLPRAFRVYPDEITHLAPMSIAIAPFDKK